MHRDERLHAEHGTEPLIRPADAATTMEIVKRIHDHDNIDTVDSRPGDSGHGFEVSAVTSGACRLEHDRSQAKTNETGVDQFHGRPVSPGVSTTSGTVERARKPCGNVNRTDPVGIQQRVVRLTECLRRRLAGPGELLGVGQPSIEPRSIDVHAITKRLSGELDG